MTFKTLTRSLCVLLLAGFASCADKAPVEPTLTVSIEPQRYFLEKIVGDRYAVRCLLVGGGNPENYDPTFANLLNAERSDAYFTLGNIGFETAIIGKIRNSRPDLKIINCSDSIQLMMGTHGGADDADPHIWSSVVNARIITANMARAMAEIDPEGKDYYMKRLKRFHAELDSIDAVARRLLAEPDAGHAFMVWHPSLSYLARDYNLQQVVVGGAEHKEPTAMDLSRSLERGRELGARVFFIQPDLDGRHARALAEDMDSVRLVPFNTLGYDWKQQMLSIINAIAGEGEDE